MIISSVTKLKFHRKIKFLTRVQTLVYVEEAPFISVFGMYMILETQYIVTNNYPWIGYKYKRRCQKYPKTNLSYSMFHFVCFSTNWMSHTLSGSNQFW